MFKWRPAESVPNIHQHVLGGEDAFVHTHTHTYRHTHTHACSYAHIYTDIYTHTCASICLRNACSRVCMSVNTPQSSVSTKPSKAHQAPLPTQPVSQNLVIKARRRAALYSHYWYVYAQNQHVYVCARVSAMTHVRISRIRLYDACKAIVCEESNYACMKCYRVCMYCAAESRKRCVHACVYVCIYTYIHTYTYTNTHTHACIHTHTCILLEHMRTFLIGVMHLTCPKVLSKLHQHAVFFMPFLVVALENESNRLQ